MLWTWPLRASATTWLKGSLLLLEPLRRNDTTMAMTDASAPTDVGAPFGAAPGTGATNVPSAETVFRDKGYVAPEVPIAQF